MVAVAVTLREVFEVGLVVGVVLSFIGESTRQHARPLLFAIGANSLLSAAIGATAGLFGASLDTKQKAIFQASMIGVGAMLMAWAVQFQPGPSRVIPAATVARWTR